MGDEVKNNGRQKRGESRAMLLEMYVISDEDKEFLARHRVRMPTEDDVKRLRSGRTKKYKRNDQDDNVYEQPF